MVIRGVVSRILPVEDMPFLPDGTPASDSSEPSRRTFAYEHWTGVLEVHLGYAAKALGWKVATPVFDGATEEDIMEALKEAGYNEDGKSVLYDGRTGEPFDNRVTVGYMHMLKSSPILLMIKSMPVQPDLTRLSLSSRWEVKRSSADSVSGEMEVWAL